MFPGARVAVIAFLTLPAFPDNDTERLPQCLLHSVSDLQGVKPCAGVAKIKNLSAEQEQAPAFRMGRCLPLLGTPNCQRALVR